MIDRRPFIRPSAIPSLALCPGKALMEARAVDLCPELLRIEHGAAKQGTMGHAANAQTLTMIYLGNDGWRSPAECLEVMAKIYAGLEPWSADAARRCVAYAVALVDQQTARGWDVEIHVEMHLPGSFLGISRGGTADLVILCRGKDSPKVVRVVVADWKLGWLDQGEAHNHLQLHAYACMANEKYSPVEGVEIHLAQGRRRDFSAASFAPEVLPTIAENVRRIAMAAFAPHPEIKPSLEACRYCKALPLCRAAREEIMKASEEAALFGIENMDRVNLAESAALAARFAEEVKLLQKEWVKTVQGTPEEKAA